MRLFERTKVKRGRPPKKPKTLKEILASALTKEVNKDPELKRELALREGGYSDLLDKDRETENKKKEIKKLVTTKALEKIQSDPELAEQFIESEVESILAGGNEGKSRRRRTEPDYFEGEGGTSSISQALEEVASLGELKEKLAELGLVDGGGGGFLKGLSMKDVLGALPYISTLMSKQGQEVKSVRTYIVQVDGKDREVSESEYKQLYEQGKLQPVAALISPKTETEPTGVEGTSELTTAVIQSDITSPELPAFLQNMDFSMIDSWLSQEPEDVVNSLKSEVDSGVEESKLIWGFLTTANYQGIAEKITPYQEHPEVGYLVKMVLSDDGRVWLEKVLTLTKETLNERE